MPKKFRFRLETVERLRKQAVDQQRRVVADAQRAANAAIEANTTWARELDDGRRGLRGVLQGQMLNVPLLRSYQLFRGWVRDKVVETRRQADAAQTELDRERARLAQVSKRLKVMENLHKRQWRRHQASVLRAEHATSDEIALQQYVRRTGMKGVD